jgi:hypothetical protein
MKQNRAGKEAYSTLLNPLIKHILGEFGVYQRIQSQDFSETKDAIFRILLQST